MAIYTFAAIYIGSYEVGMKIFELSAKKKLRVIDYVRKRIEIGRDTFSKGNIGYEMVEALCDTLGQYVAIMKEYKVEAYEAYAATAIRDSGNELFILDQIKIRTGLTVQVLSNSEHRFINYQSLAAREEFEDMVKKGAAVIDVGGGGLQITVFKEGNIVKTEHLALGAMRLREQLEKQSVGLEQYELQIEETVNKELEVFSAMYMQGVDLSYLIFIGDYITEIMSRTEKNHSDKTVKAEKFVRYLERLRQKNIEQICAELGLSNENDPLVVPYMIVFGCMAKKLGAQELWVPGVSISDGIACGYALKHNIYRISHDFEQDILSAARSLAGRYLSYSPHIEALCAMSTLIFDTMKKMHGLSKRERLLIQVAAILHDCGKYISFANAPQCSYDIIMGSEILGLTHHEREIIANTVLYNTYTLPDYHEATQQMDHEAYLTVAKLSAILRVSNAMDRSHKQKFKNVKAAVRGKELVITIETEDDIALEKTLFHAKTAYFEKVFSVKPVVKRKRIYKV